jgi:predicted transcriptional regulator
MLTKEKLRNTIDNLPDDNFSIDEIIERLIILDKVEQGLQDVKDGNVHTTGEVRKKLERWLK